MDRLDKDELSKNDLRDVARAKWAVTIRAFA